MYVELEGMALSRSVPAGLGLLVNPVVSRLSQSSLVTSLSQTREAVRSLSQRAGRIRAVRTLECGGRVGLIRRCPVRDVLRVVLAEIAPVIVELDDLPDGGLSAIVEVRSGQLHVAQ